MASTVSLVDLFNAMTQSVEQDRAHLNHLDRDDGDVGDNAVANFGMVTNALSQALNQNNGQADVGEALQQAASILRSQGQGATAPIYAQGLEEAGRKLEGRNDFGIEDLLPLLEGLLRGSQQASGTQAGDGSLLDVLLPAVMAYMQSKQSGATDVQALMAALLAVRRGTTGTASSSRGYGQGSGRDTTGQVDPGAAAAASLLEGLFGSLLNGLLGGKNQPAQGGTQSAPDRGGDNGGLFGSGGARV